MAKNKHINTTEQKPEKALLISVYKPGHQIEALESLEELTHLAYTARAEVMGQITQALDVPSKSYYLGSGKLEEIKQLKSDLGFTTAIFDEELSPTQQRNLENELKIKIIDRVALILDIFAQRAQTAEGKLQVDLAQAEYLKPRLAGQWSHLERLGGGIGTRGPGESQLETDRRIIESKIARLKKRLKEVAKRREQYRKQRKDSKIPVVAIVGYTNSGKSTLLNLLSGANVLAEDKLFATLDPTTRRLCFPDRPAFLLTDTVGFIRKLPVGIVEAFKATLEETVAADVLVHVVDFTSSQAGQQYNTVQEILKEIGAANKPQITLLNKIDILSGMEELTKEEILQRFANLEYGFVSGRVIPVSVQKSWNIERFIEELCLLVQKIQ
ncbi:MAG: GTPase HflX [Chloroflexi bacterium]|nr:GTPase HflX [Chloroflexota bacterium]